MDINTILEMNKQGKTLLQIANDLGSSKSTIQRLLIKNGYVYNKKTKLYEIVSRETTTNNSIQNNETNKNVSHETIVNGSYSIPKTLSKALKRKALEEDKNLNEIIEAALKTFIESKYFKSL